MEEICDGCIGSSMSNFKIFLTTILYKGMTNDDNETSIILNVDANMDDLKYFVGTSDILES